MDFTFSSKTVYPLTIGLVLVPSIINLYNDTALLHGSFNLVLLSVLPKLRLFCYIAMLYVAFPVSYSLIYLNKHTHQTIALSMRIPFL